MIRPESFRPRLVQLLLGLEFPVRISFVLSLLLVGRQPFLFTHAGILASCPLTDEFRGRWQGYRVIRCLRASPHPCLHLNQLLNPVRQSRFHLLQLAHQHHRARMVEHAPRPRTVRMHHRR